MKRVALVTGGVGGIGTAICKRLAHDGHVVIANYAIPGSEVKWREAMDRAGLNGNASLAFGDVSDFDAMGEMVKKVTATHGPVDILVNCAGITRDSTFRKMTPDQWRAVLSTNLDSVFNVTRHVIDAMVERGWGRVINNLVGERGARPVRPDQLLGREGRCARLHQGACAGSREEGRDRERDLARLCANGHGHGDSRGRAPEDHRGNSRRKARRPPRKSPMPSRTSPPRAPATSPAPTSR